MNLNEIDAAIEAAKDRGAWSTDAVRGLIRAAEAMRKQLFGTTPAGEDPMPVFVIKGKDRFALAAVNAYRQLCVDAGLTDQAIEVTAAYVEINKWQRRNPDMVNLPNHPHVPAS